MLIKRVKRTIEKYNMLSKNDTVIVGVSGGVDSVILLYILNEIKNEFNISIILAHVDHGLRGEESYRDLMFVKELADKYSYPLEIKSVKNLKGGSVQERGRTIRYSFFEELSERYNANKIALGHNYDDQAETVLMRLFRGSGSGGLKGIPPVRDKYIRPLIEVKRSDIEEFAKSKGIVYINDSSNLKNIYLRNSIRMELIPLIKNKYNQNIVDDLNRISYILRDDDEYLNNITKKMFTDFIIEENERHLVLDINMISNLHIGLQRRIIRHAINRIKGNLRRINYLHIDSVIRLKRNGKIILPDNIFVEKEYNKIIVANNRYYREPIYFEYNLNIPGLTFIKELDIKIVTEFVQKKDIHNSSKSNNIAYFDHDKLKFPLVVRNFREGDRLKDGKKVKKYFIDNKIPKRIRRNIPLLLSEERIIWILGYKISKRAEADISTKKWLKISILDMHE